LTKKKISKVAQVLGSEGFIEYAHKYLAHNNNKDNKDKEEEVEEDEKNEVGLSSTVLKTIGTFPKLSWVDYAKKILQEEEEGGGGEGGGGGGGGGEEEGGGGGGGFDGKVEERMKLATPEALDLLDGLLCFDRQKRLTAKQAKQHPYFDGVRSQMRSLNKSS
jgi:serine/threonine protein kinase